MEKYQISNNCKNIESISWKFWDTQPVPKLEEKILSKTQGPIEDKNKKVPQTPYK